MRGGRRLLWGVTAIVLGLIILLALVLPSQFWWFAFAALLIAAGLWMLGMVMKIYVIRLPRFLGRLLAGLRGRSKRSEKNGTAV